MPLNRPGETDRERMIREHSEFLSWALHHPDARKQLTAERTRIPRRRVNQGGFTQFLSHPGARVLVKNFWDRLLNHHYPH